MVWYELNIGKHKAKIHRIEKKRAKFPSVDKDGNELKIEFKKIHKCFNKDGVEVSKTYKLINGKVKDKLKKTKEVDVYELVNPTEINDLIVEMYYLVDCETLREELIEKKQIAKFPFTNGNGWNVKVVYVVPYMDKLIMVGGYGSLKDEIAKISEVKSKEKEEVVEEVERATESELLEAVA